MEKLRHGARVTTNASVPLLCTRRRSPLLPSLWPGCGMAVSVGVGLHSHATNICVYDPAETTQHRAWEVLGSQVALTNWVSAVFQSISL